MEEIKYQILFDYDREGNIIDDDKFDTIDEAIKNAVGRNNCTKFRIITVVWEPN